MVVEVLSLREKQDKGFRLSSNGVERFRQVCKLLEERPEWLAEIIGRNPVDVGDALAKDKRLEGTRMGVVSGVVDAADAEIKNCRQSSCITLEATPMIGMCGRLCSKWICAARCATARASNTGHQSAPFGKSSAPADIGEGTSLCVQTPRSGFGGRGGHGHPRLEVVHLNPAVS